MRRYRAGPAIAGAGLVVSGFCPPCEACGTARGRRVPIGKEALSGPKADPEHLARFFCQIENLMLDFVWIVLVNLLAFFAAAVDDRVLGQAVLLPPLSATAPNPSDRKSTRLNSSHSQI